MTSSDFVVLKEKNNLSPKHEMHYGIEISNNDSPFKFSLACQEKINEKTICVVMNFEDAHKMVTCKKCLKYLQELRDAFNVKY